jgi:hypothetical protein
VQGHRRGGGSNAWEVSVEIDTARVPSPISRPAAGVRCGDDRERRSEGQGDLGRRVRYRWCHRFVAVYCADDEHMSRFASGRLRPHGDRSTLDRMADRRALPPVMGRCRRVETRRLHSSDRGRLVEPGDRRDRGCDELLGTRADDDRTDDTQRTEQPPASDSPRVRSHPTSRRLRGSGSSIRLSSWLILSR